LTKNLLRVYKTQESETNAVLLETKAISDERCKLFMKE